MEATARAWMEVDPAALGRNLDRLARRVGGAGRVLAMVKADGYGLGAVRVARVLRDRGVWGLGVATAAEGAELRRAGIGGRVVVFSPCAPLDAGAMRAKRLEPVATSLAALEAYADGRGSGERNGAAGEREPDGEGGGPGTADGTDGGPEPADGPLPVHLEVDTGMGRFGLPAGEVEAWAPRVAAAVRSGRVRLESALTHFHSAEEDPEATRGQWNRFRAVVERLRAEGADPGVVHAANSAACFGDPVLLGDLVRPGLYLFGGGRGDPAPEPVVRVRARVLDVRDVPTGTTVSYGATYTTERPSRLATLGIGYADGLPWALSGRGRALVGGRAAPIRGRVCMDVTVVDVTGRGDVVPGRTATLLGRDGEEEITLSELATSCGTIEYEILTGFSERLPRVAAAAGGTVGADATGTAPGGAGGGRGAGRVDGGARDRGAGSGMTAD